MELVATALPALLEASEIYSARTVPCDSETQGRSTDVKQHELHTMGGAPVNEASAARRANYMSTIHAPLAHALLG